MACATCHDPNRAFGPPNAMPVQLGGVELKQPGLRAVPSLKYMQAVPPFTEHYFESDDEGDDSIDNGPTGGLTWDGRVDRDRDQARIPLLSPFEMANADAGAVVAKVRRAGYADELRQDFRRRRSLTIPTAAFAGIVEALEVFQQDYRCLLPVQQQIRRLSRRPSPADAAGGAGAWRCSTTPDKGNCGNCHRSERGKDGTPPQFTDYGLIAIGVPRNRDIPPTAIRTSSTWDCADRCAPTSPTVPNIAAASSPRPCATSRCGRASSTTARCTALRKAIDFYVERDTDPGQMVSARRRRRRAKFDDLPARYRGNVNIEPPFGRRPGDPPSLSSNEIDDMIAFLNTLTDGYEPAR